MLMEIEGLDKLSAPPGFVSRSSFLLKKVEDVEENCSSTDHTSASQKNAVPTSSTLGEVDVLTLKESLRSRPWMLYEQSNHNEEESVSAKPVEVTSRWCPENARTDAFEDAPVLYPTEEEFSDTLKYITSVRRRLEQYGICRIVPPPCWKPPNLTKEKSTWEDRKFVTQIQRTGGLHHQQSKRFSMYVNSKKRKLITGLEHNVGNGSALHLDEAECSHSERFIVDTGPEFTLNEFKKYADDFKDQYFSLKNMKANSMGFQEQREPSTEDIENEFRRIVESPNEEIEVLYGDNINTGYFGSGFPNNINGSETSGHHKCMKSGWNLNNLPGLPGSLLSFESRDTSDILVPRLRIGMCFSAFGWRVEDHHLYSLCYMHLGAPRVWYCVPIKYAVNFNAAMKKHLPDLSVKQLEVHEMPVTDISLSMLKFESVPVYRCIQYPGEFVMVLPGAYYSGFDCGFNCSEAVNFAPIDWLPHGLHVAEIYREQKRKTSVSYDKLLLEAAKASVKALWKISLLRKKNPTSDDIIWKGVSGTDGILAKALMLRIKMESNRRKYLCSSSQSKRMDRSFDLAGKRECCICSYDLHLSAVGCLCSANRFSCLNHVKQLSCCTWSKKIFLFRYEISELNLLLEAVRGKLSSVYKCCRDDFRLYKHSSDAFIHNSNLKYLVEQSKLNEHKSQDSAIDNSVGICTVSSCFKVELKADSHLLKSSNGVNDKTMKSTTASNGTAENTSLRALEDLLESSFDSFSNSSSSDSDETSIVASSSVKGDAS